MVPMMIEVNKCFVLAAIVLLAIAFMLGRGTVNRAEAQREPCGSYMNPCYVIVKDRR